MKNVLFFLIAAGVAGCAWSQESIPWKDGWAYRKTLEVTAATDTAPVEQAAVFTFSGCAKDDGSDIRLAGPDGGDVPFFPVRVGPGNCYTISFPASAGRVYLYYGNPSAGMPETGFTLKRGLLLETFARAIDRAETGEEMKTAIASTTGASPLGRGFFATIWDASNPFTPEGNIFKKYTGWFHLEKPETMSFGTTSTGPSCILIDDAVVASWFGWHWAEGFIRPEHAGTVSLEAGLHRLTYWHMAKPGWVMSVAAVKPAGTDRFKTIPPDFFLPLVFAKSVKIEKAGGGTVPEFEWENTNYLSVEGRELLTFRFRDAGLAGTDIADRRWDFGDGQTGSGAEVLHTYLKAGFHTVTLAVRDKSGTSATVALRVKVEQAYGNLQLQPREGRVYLDEFSGWDLKKHDSEHLFLLAGIYAFYDLPERELACREVLRTRNLSPEEKTKTDFIAADLAARVGQPAEAERIYRDILKGTLLPEALLQLGLLYLDTDRPDKVQETARILLAIKDLQKPLKRNGEICLADSFRMAGETVKAKEIYDRLTNKERMIAQNGNWAQQVIYYLKNNDWPTAFDRLNKWQDEVPAAKLTGHWSVLFARACMLKKDYRRGIRELDIFMKNTPGKENPYLAWGLYLSAEIYRAKGDNQKADEFMKRLRTDFPGSPLSLK